MSKPDGIGFAKRYKKNLLSNTLCHELPIEPSMKSGLAIRIQKNGTVGWRQHARQDIILFLWEIGHAIHSGGERD